VYLSPNLPSTIEIRFAIQMLLPLNTERAAETLCATFETELQNCPSCISAPWLSTAQHMMNAPLGFAEQSISPELL